MNILLGNSSKNFLGVVTLHIHVHAFATNAVFPWCMFFVGSFCVFCFLRTHGNGHIKDSVIRFSHFRFSVQKFVKIESYTLIL